MYRWIIFLHVVSAFSFFMAHGVSISVVLQLRHERSPERLRSLLELSEASRLIVRLSLAAILLSGIVGGFMLDWWRMGWIWVSLVLLIFMTVVMVGGMSPYFNKLRKAAGSPYTEGGKRRTAQNYSADELETLLNSAHMLPMVVIGVSILMVIVYLMMFKPF